MIEELTFHRLGIQDLADLVVLEQQCFSAPWKEEQFLLGLEREVFKVFGLKDGDELVAYCSFYHVVDEMEILNIAVVPERRRHGAGRRLLSLVLQICLKMGIQNGHLEVRVGNVAARALYASFGFQEIGVRKGYYPDNGEDAILMRLDLENLSGA
ncbi:ribosomal protein S18-alanine N-acetyltransferase [Desulfovibrio ferrophilus]|uniref:[Ribosomal protein bS18]-alanine N-acetyltransferase n=1 Tax=Desulfovibrio ferrophilus TaxID=241368 RepID=A0A2Z6AWS4_9BACT|nr:ribosomal protein S18-alanine N-acetyltransferase [Desulfovibrio ferrophilus]BBD07648.1 ribosomal-protein-alanine acetyltransferase [Desulfovibrio ferrophilus]